MLAMHRGSFISEVQYYNINQYIYKQLYLMDNITDTMYMGVE